jgi:hypothetical protein
MVNAVLFILGQFIGQKTKVICSSTKARIEEMKQRNQWSGFEELPLCSHGRNSQVQDVLHYYADSKGHDEKKNATGWLKTHKNSNLS